jgi:hypothetical protein
MPTRSVNNFLLQGWGIPLSWGEALYIALKKGSIAGVVLGAGVWLKNKLHERHRK